MMEERHILDIWGQRLYNCFGDRRLLLSVLYDRENKCNYVSQIIYKENRVEKSYLFGVKVIIKTETEKQNQDSSFLQLVPVNESGDIFCCVDNNLNLYCIDQLFDLKPGTTVAAIPDDYLSFLNSQNNKTDYQKYLLSADFLNFVEECDVEIDVTSAIEKLKQPLISILIDQLLELDAKVIDVYPNGIIYSVEDIIDDFDIIEQYDDGTVRFFAKNSVGSYDEIILNDNDIARILRYLNWE